MPVSCPACGGDETSVIYDLGEIPVQSCILFDDRESAVGMDRAPLRLNACDSCGLVFNELFNPQALDYADMTEESQHFSGTFNRFAIGLVEEIAERYDLAGKQTVEIGCGKGDFLRQLAERTGTKALGIDPGFIANRNTEDGPDIEFRKEFFDPAKVDREADFVVCRHTLEHIPDVGRFAGQVAEICGPETATFFETPDVMRVLSEGAFWDIYYEHCSYFSVGTHARLFRANGFHVSDIRLDYDDQYIIQYAAPGEGNAQEGEDDLDTLRDLFKSFPETVANERKKWTDFLAEEREAGRSVALWGGGSKAVSFLTTNDITTDQVAQVIDINPFKQGRFLPGTGHRVSAPGELPGNPPDTVIAMNSIYLKEIEADLANMGLKPKLVGL